jgi:hypothetical protein
MENDSQKIRITTYYMKAIGEERMEISACREEFQLS